MNKKLKRILSKSKHLLISLFFFIVLLIIDWKFNKHYVNSGDIYFVMLAGIAPDIDQHFEHHRDFFTHSIIFPSLMLFGGFGNLEQAIILSVGLHLFFDISLRKKEGFYCIKLGRKTLNYKTTNILLLVNFGLSLILFFLPST